jgi:hypothetical protein
MAGINIDIDIDGASAGQQAAGPAAAFLVAVAALTRSVGSGALVPRPLGLGLGGLVAAFAAAGLAAAAWPVARRVRASRPPCLAPAMLGLYAWVLFVLGLLAIAIVAAHGDYSYLEHLGGG